MKLKTKFSLEIILLVALIGMVSTIAIINTKTVQDSFLDLSSHTLPTWDALKDMKLATSLMSTATTEIMLLQDGLLDKSGSSESLAIEERLEFQMFEMETAKSLFTESFTRYSILMEDNFPEAKSYGEEISQNWNNAVITSNKIISMTARGGTTEEIIILKNQFDENQVLLNNAIFSAMSFIEPHVENNQKTVGTLVDNTTMQILIVLNLFIISSLIIKLVISRSISRPLVQLRTVTRKIAEGNFVKTEIKGDDEISELGKDIDLMSGELAKLNREIVTSERLSSIGSLASRLAHDLRNPLSVIKNSMEILKFRLNDNMDEKINHQIAMVGRAIARMSHQIEDVLDFVNVADLKLQSSSMITIIESALLSTDVPKSLKINMPKNSATALCDPFRMEVVFSNLIKNASQANDGKGDVSIRIRDEKEYVIIEVEDQGTGVPEENIDKIFEPLFTTKQSGTGLGLASCKSIVDRHGGTITVQNNPTVFTVKIPKIPKKTKHPNKELIQKSLLNE